MLSDSPPDRDVIWTEEGVQGSAKFVQRLWRLVGELKRAAAGAPGGCDAGARALDVRQAAPRARLGRGGGPANGGCGVLVLICLGNGRHCHSSESRWFRTDGHW